MTAVDCEQLVDGYLRWLKANIDVRAVQGACEITTPFLDRHNDHLLLYVQPANGALKLTDDGYVIADLEQSGVEVSTPKRKAILKSVLAGYGVQLSETQELFVLADMRTLPQKKHCLLQAMLAVNDMFTMAVDRVASVFAEDVERFLRSHQIRFAPRIKLPGKSSFDHTIDFLVPASKNHAERIIRLANRASRDAVTNILFAAEDIRAIRSQEDRWFLLFNDAERALAEESQTALANYQITPVPWSARERHVDAWLN